jgi:hypothetical protein
MIYQEMYGYLTIEDPRERDKVWQSLSPQVKDYLNVFFNMLGDIDNPPYYENSKFYRLITKEEFESLIKVFYSTQQSQADVIDAAFEEEFKQAIIAYEKKSAMKAKMNQWRAEMEPSITAEPTSVQENVFYSRQQRMVENEDVAENTRNYIPQNSGSGSSSGKSTGGCLIAIVAGILILLALYWGSK